MVDLEEPDKGRAWVVALSACIINMILSGISRMVSYLYVSVIYTYGVTRGDATMPFSVRNSVRCLAGPVVGIIGVRFGIRKVTFFGGVMAFAGAALCSIAPNVVWLTIFWGGIHGLGFAFANTLFQVVVNQYFQKYRATASGIALSGACLGSLAFPVLIEYILENFSLSGTFLILGGIVMHVLPPSLLLSSPQWVEHPEAYARLWKLQHWEAADGTNADHTDSDESSSDKEVPLKKSVSRTISMSNNPVESTGVSKASRDHNWDMQSGAIFDHSDCTKRKGNVTCTKYQPRKSSGVDSKADLHNRQGASSNATKDDFSIFTISGEMEKQEKATHEPCVDPCPAETPAQKKGPPSILEMLMSMVHLYTIPVYILISVCMSTYIIIFIPMLTVVVDYSKDKGFPESYGKFLINAMAIGDMIGRLGFGWVTDKNIMTLPIFMFWVLALQGVFVAVLPIASSLSAFVTVLVLYSVAAGCLLVIFPVFVLHYIDKNVQSVAIANVGLLSGITSFGIPPMIEQFRDNLGSYDGMFYLTGIISMISGSLWLLVPIVAKFGYARKNRSSQIITTEEESDHDMNKEIITEHKKHGKTII